jgi:hypothetical protein
MQYTSLHPTSTAIKLLFENNPDKLFKQCDIVDSLADIGIIVSRREVRRHIEDMRNMGAIPLLVSSSKGYCIARHPEQLLAYLSRVHNQIQAMKSTANALAEQWERTTGQVPVFDHDTRLISLVHIDDVPPPVYQHEETGLTDIEVFKDWRQVNEWENRESQKAAKAAIIDNETIYGSMKKIAKKLQKSCKY